MIKKQLCFILILVFGFLFLTELVALAQDKTDAITYRIDYTEKPQENLIKFNLTFLGKKGSEASYDLDAYKAIYELGTNKLLKLEYENVFLEKPFQRSSNARFNLFVDTVDTNANLYKIKLLLFDKNNELKPILIADGFSNEYLEFANVPDYYYEESQRVIENINQLFEEKKDHDFLTFGVMTDSHIGIGIQEEKMLKESFHHGLFALSNVGMEIGSDFIVHLGDTTWENNIDTYNSYTASFYTADAFRFVANDYNRILLIGNHDQTVDHNRQWDAIGRFNNFEKIGLNQKRSYGYTDFYDKKVRVISLNTCDYLNGSGSYGLSYEQRDFLMNSLDLSEKENVSEWKILILSHFPLDFYYKSNQWTDYDVTKDVIGILNAYQGGSSYSIYVNSLWKAIHNDTIPKTILTYDYAGKNQAKIIGNIHGHLHNDCYGTLAYTDMEGQRFTTDITRVATPNTAFYGAKATAYPENGDYVATLIKKVADTQKDTSITFYMIDLTDEIIYSYAYGAGNDRIIPYKK